MTSLDVSPTLLQTLRFRSGEVSAADIRGEWLAVAGGDRALRLWRWQRGAGWLETATVKQAHRYGVTGVKWSPGGALIATSGVDGAARVWGARPLIARRLLAAPGASAARALCWAGHARLLAGHDDGAICVWNVMQGSLVARLHAHSGALHALAAPARHALLLAACTEGVLKLFDLQEVCRCWQSGLPAPSALSWVDAAHDMGALCAAAARGGDRVATAGHDARIRVWKITTADGTRGLESISTLEGHSAAVTAVCWSREVLASASLDRTARLWVDGACICVLPAHNRYLTTVILDPEMRYLVTGSNDKSLRMWSLGALDLDAELVPPCHPHAHFGVGDLEGIGPIDSDELLEMEAKGLPGGGAGAAGRATHDGAVNCIAASHDLVATACSDGMIRIHRWSPVSGLVLEQTLGERGYPALAADFAAGGAVLLTGGMDGTARVWDVETGCLLRLLNPPSVSESDSGGGGVRGARAAGRTLLLVTDDGLAPVWNLTDPDPTPLHVYAGHPEGAVCCAVSGDGRLLAAGGAGGELRLHRAPPRAALLCHQADAHDLGVQSCDFAPRGVLMEEGDVGSGEGEGEDGDEGHWQYLLATAGSDGLIKLWVIDLTQYEATCDASMTLVRELSAHGGGVACVRWGMGADPLLASGGADRWARVWRVREGGEEGELSVSAEAAVPAEGPGGATAVALMEGGYLAVGTLAGELSVWALPGEDGEGAGEDPEEDSEPEDEDCDVGADARWWGPAAAARWLREYVARVPGSSISTAAEESLLSSASAAALCGARLLDDPLDQLLEALGLDIVVGEEDVDTERVRVRQRLLDAVKWLRRDPPPPEISWSAPHALLCPVSHDLITEPARAADGCTYDRNALQEWFLASDGAVSCISGRRMRNKRVWPNHRAAAALRAYVLQYQADRGLLDT